MTHKEKKLMQSLGSRHGRKKSGMFLCEGVRACEEALTRRPDWHVLTVCSATFHAGDAAGRFDEMVERTGRPMDILPDYEFAAVAVTENPQGILSILKHPGCQPPECPVDPFVLILNRVTDPGNLGTILRTAWAIGLRSTWLTPGGADPFGPKAIRAGMGAQFSLDLFVCADLIDVRERLLTHQYSTLWCTVPTGGISCYSDAFELRRSALVIGNEANGIEDPSIGRAVSIPMPGNAESLNAAQAATIFLFEGVRRGIMT